MLTPFILVVNMMALLVSGFWENQVYEKLPSLKGTFAGRAMEHSWMLANLAGYCVFPANGFNFKTFNQAYFRQFGVEYDDLERHVSFKDTFNDTVYTRAEEPRIPLKTHRMWITHPVISIEMRDSVKNDTIFDEILSTNRALDDENHTWEHYFWTNDAKAIPETVKWFKDNGFIIMELRDLPRNVYDPVLEGLVDSYLEERFGAASDIIRFMILYVHGGFYMDMDYFVRKFDNEILYYFDSIHTRHRYYINIIFNTYGLLVAAYHPETKVYLDIMREAHIKRGLQQVQLASCYHKTK